MGEASQPTSQIQSTPASNGSVSVATPSQIVPPSSAIPQTKVYGVPPLPRKAVTLESLGEGARSDPPSPLACLPDRQEDSGLRGTGKQEEKITDYGLLIAHSKPDASQSAISNQQSVIVEPTDQPASDSLELPDLSPEAIEFLTSARYQQSAQMLRQELALSDDDISFLGEMDHAAFGKLIDLEQYINALLNEFPNLNAEEKRKLIGIVIAYRYLPFSSLFKPTPEEAANHAGIALPPAPYYRIYSKPLTYRGAAHEVARMAGVELMGQTQERLRDLVISKIKGIRTNAQIEELLMRTSELGGMGLNEDKARGVREAMEDILGRAKIITEEEYSRQLNREIHERHVLQQTTDSSAAIPKTPLGEDEEKEIKAIVASMPRPKQDVSPILAASVRAILERLSWKPEDGYLRHRLENVISTRLRGMHSRNELFMKLMRDDKVGGLGLDRTEADRLASEIETGCEEFRTQVLNEEKQKILTEQDIQRKKIEERKKRESEEHARWYEEKVKSRQAGAAGSEADMNPLEKLKSMVKKAGLTTPIHPIDAKEEAKERSQFGELVTALNAAKTSKAQETASNAFAAIAPSPSANSSAEATGFKKATGDTAQAVPIPERNVPTQQVIKVSAETMRMQEKAPVNLRPKVEDVQPPSSSTSRGLVGPVQEIGNITLDRFRRLSAKPADAANRIRALIDLLAEESFEKRILGIQAWRSCPLQKQYLGLVAKAFSSRLPVNTVADQLRTKGEQVPTAEEITAIVTLNGELKL
ncbi:MAG: hypothetical protein WC477_04515 [Patescibacteria group bacterium]